MNIDWTSFSLEIINFLVLVWLLKHFLYKPVMDIIGGLVAAGLLFGMLAVVAVIEGGR